MQLCKHLESVYKNELALNNEVLSIGIGYETGIQISVFFKRPMQSKKLPDGLETSTFTACHYPSEFYVECKSCRMILSFPLEEDQKDNYAPASWERPDPQVIATADTVIFPEDYHKTGIRPTLR